MSLTVKAYLGHFEKRDGGNEIRRFAVEEGVATNYEYLQRKIVQVFPDLAKKFSLFWKDQEGDYIAFSSDDELTEALGFVSDGIFRVYIKEIAAAAKGPSIEENHDEIHPGVVCDGCESHVRGFRFKCLTCPDYDLCSGCEHQGVHTEHNMMKIIRPQNNFMAQMQNMFMGGPGRFGPVPRHPHGPPPPAYGGPPPPPHGCPPPPPPPHHGGPPHPHPEGPMGPCGFPQGAFPPHMRKFMRRCWRRYWREMNGDPVKGCKGKKGKKGKKSQGDEPHKEKEPNQKESSSDSSSDEAEVSPSEDYLKNVGESVAAMLDPLGIDVQVDVEHRGRRGRCGGRGGPGWSGPWGRGGWGGRGCPAGGRGGRGRGGWGGPAGPWAWAWGRANNAETSEEQPQSTKAAPQKENTMDVEETTPEPEKTQNKANGEKMDEGSETSGKPPSPPNGEDWTFVGSNSGYPQPGVSAPNQPSANAPTGSPAPTASAQSAGLYPQVPENPMNALIADAVVQMQAMGFDNDGGWLTRLLEAKKGNISGALDAIQSHKK